ncbi:recombinase family protein [Paramicrobacterium agarici]|uniref:recombinase family protein n=1 Tax=Paramicrobacterium agarici TaxID=630514 RepID=UPI001151F402|nr:recombinase family protein [Microbacterium agarici]TQO24250.1 DNA invertase Pin-like site-specific DNA recombinase [Microbacterium agarici]
MARIGYARVSTTDGKQTTDSQNRALRQTGVDRIFEDHVSGSTDPGSREGWKRLLDFARPGEDVIVVYRIDRVARSLRRLLETLDELQRRELDFESVSESLDSSTATGRLMIGLLGSVAEFERSLITERVQAGLAAARERNGGVHPGGRPRSLSQDQIDIAIARRKRNEPMTTIARDLKVSRATLYRALGS